MVDEVDEVDLALLDVRNVTDHCLKAFRLERRTQELDGVLARVEHGDRGLAVLRAASPHRVSLLVDLPAGPNRRAVASRGETVGSLSCRDDHVQPRAMRDAVNPRGRSCSRRWRSARPDRPAWSGGG